MWGEQGEVAALLHPAEKEGKVLTIIFVLPACVSFDMYVPVCLHTCLFDLS